METGVLLPVVVVESKTGRVKDEEVVAVEVVAVVVFVVVVAGTIVGGIFVGVLVAVIATVDDVVDSGNGDVEGVVIADDENDDGVTIVNGIVVVMNVVT